MRIKVGIGKRVKGELRKPGAGALTDAKPHDTSSHPIAEVRLFLDRGKGGQSGEERKAELRRKVS